ncbi:MAG: aminotransferase class I/II-fold pyridoxal phosphate-dependent enzyme [Clostridia bacterium]|nr:aminotransferase class I/II-fold pyridoxal phosphate-dependent enzyme [Clostridia bacterium]
MAQYSDLSKEELISLKSELEKKYEEIKSLGLKLDMSRGKPNKAQLDLSNEVLDVFNSKSDVKSVDGTDTRNYGLLLGIDEARQLFAELMDVPMKNTVIFGTASLTIMYDYIAQCMMFGCGDEPWVKQGKIKFLCPAPGYDRHFSILEHFGIEMITVKMLDDGPDMDTIEELVKDSSVKGAFCVPKYSNPDGITFSDEVVRRFAALKPAAKDFRVIWDNAYIVHDINDTPDELLNIFDVAKEYGSEDMFIEVCSTSKISFAGAGVSALAASDKNVKDILARLTIQVISHDKMNQLRHARYFKNLDGIKAHMKKHAEILKPKFDAVTEGFSREFDGTGIAHWKKPNGGYFVSLYVMNGCAKRVGELCKDAGLTLTTVGATYPYGIDPDDSNIRIAPSFPDVDELEKAVELLAVCVKLAAVEKLLNN